jgi:hypothetical protein
MLFDPFESVVLFLSVIIVNQTLSDGKVGLAVDESQDNTDEARLAE